MFENKKSSTASDRDNNITKLKERGYDRLGPFPYLNTLLKKEISLHS
jgi:hypothetical protein